MKAFKIKNNTIVFPETFKLLSENVQVFLFVAHHVFLISNEVLYLNTEGKITEGNSGDMT